MQSTSLEDIDGEYGGVAAAEQKQPVVDVNDALNGAFADGFVLVHENGGQDLWSYYCPFVKVTMHRGCVAVWNWARRRTPRPLMQQFTVP